MNDITCASCGKPVADFRHFCDVCLEAEKARQVQAIEPDYVACTSEDRKDSDRLDDLEGIDFEADTEGFF